jgi:hypothetical protein
MSSLDALPPGVVERINEFGCRLEVNEHSKQGVTLRQINWYQYGEKTLFQLLLVSRRFLGSLTPPPRPARCTRDDQKTWLRLGPPIIIEVD